MKKSNNVTRLTIASVLAATMLAAALPVVGNAAPVRAEGTANKTAVITTSQFTRISAPIALSSGRDKNHTGASIEFDVLSSDLKQQANIDHLHGVDGLSQGASASSIRDLAWAGVSFGFYRDEDIFNNNAFNLLGQTTSDTSACPFTYYADGQIRMFYSAAGNVGRILYSVTELDANGDLVWGSALDFSAVATYPVTAKPYGDINEVKTFLDPGYSYKVEEAYANVTETDGEITVARGQSYGQDGYWRQHAWYIAYKKAVGTSESEYQPIFAFPIPRGSEMQTNQSAEAYYAAFEINGSTALIRNGWYDDQYNPNARTVTMEIDNITIKDNESTPTKTTATFDTLSASSDFILADEDDVNINAPKINRYHDTKGYTGAYGAAYRSYYGINETTVDGLKIMSINAPIETIGGAAARSLNTYYNVSYTVDGETSVEMVKEADASAYTLSTVGKEGTTLLGWLNKADNKLYKAGAAYPLVTNSAFEAVYVTVENVAGASVRMGGDDGIRFESRVTGNLALLDEAGVEYELGAYITDANNTKTAGGKCDIIVDNADGSYTYYAVLSGLEGYYETQFIADAYVKVTYADGSTEEFSATDAVETRSYLYVVEAALNDVKKTNTEAETYTTKITVGDVEAYSCYSKANYDSLVAMYKVITGNDFTLTLAD